MIMVLVAKIVGSVTRCEPPEGLPACDWYIYAGVGMILGGLALPAIAISKLRASKRSKGPNDRS